jgi:hypothetical protein
VPHFMYVKDNVQQLIMNNSLLEGDRYQNIYLCYFVSFSSKVYVLNFICITLFYFYNKQLQN